MTKIRAEKRPAAKVDRLASEEFSAFCDLWCDQGGTQVTLADALGTTPSQIWRWSYGQFAPPYIRLALSALVHGHKPWSAK